MINRIYYIVFIFSILYSSISKIDINSGDYDSIMSLPLSKNKNNQIYSFISSSGKISTIYDLLLIPQITSRDIHKLKDYIKITSDKYNFSLNKIYKTHGWLTEDGNSEGLSELYLHHFYNPVNVNHMNYDDLYAIPNLTPMDVVAVLKRKKGAKIEEDFHLKNSGMSNYGYKNLVDFVSYDDNIANKIYIRYNMMAQSFPSSSGVDEESIPFNFTNLSSPGTNIKFSVGRINNKNNISAGIVRANNVGESPNVYSNKFFISLDPIKNNRNSFTLDKIIIGNFKASFGQGVVFESTDYANKRGTGYKFNKRQTGISADITKSSQFTLSGIAAQMRNENLSFAFFVSNGFLLDNNKRDAIINSDGSFSALLSMNQRLPYGYSNNKSIIHDSLINSVDEKTIGANIIFSPMLNTNFGFTFYESHYNRALDPQIEDTILDEGGAPQYLNYMSNSADSEINAMYGNSVKSSFWASKSFRRVFGYNFNTVINNMAIQAEYGQLDTNKDYFDNEPSAFILNTYMAFNTFDLLILYRNYDLDYDNPYQRSFSEYQRYKQTIFDDDHNLNDLIYYNLYQSNPQPQAEEGIYIQSRYSFHRNMVASIEWDSWIRQADKAQYYRIVGKLDWKPVFKYRINFRYKWQSRAPYDIGHQSPYHLKEARITGTLTLSNYNKMILFYSWNSSIFNPKPRITNSPNPFVSQMTIGDISSPDVSIGTSFEHRIDDHMKVKAGIVYVGGFLWYIEDNDFRILDSNSGLLYNWIAFDFRANNFLTLKMKVSHASEFATTTVSDVVVQNGNYIDSAYSFDENFNYKIQLDYVF